MRISDWSSDVCSSDLATMKKSEISSSCEKLFAGEAIVEPFAGHLVAAVGEPAIGLKKDRGAEELVAVPPIARAARRATGAENTLVKPVELFAFGRRLEALLAARRSSEERRVGKECVSTCRSWWWPEH